MADLQFENQTNEFGVPPQERPGSDLTDMLIKWGLVSSRKEAEYALVGVAILALVIAYFVYGSLGGSAPPPPPVGV